MTALDGKQLRKGARVFITYATGERAYGTVDRDPAPEDILTSRGVVREVTVPILWDDGDCTGERPQDIDGVLEER